MNLSDIGRVRRILGSGDTRGMREGALAGLAFSIGSGVFIVTGSWLWVVMVTVPFIASVVYVARPRRVMSLSITEHQNEPRRNCDDR